MDTQSVKKLTYFINTVILFIVIGLMAFFYVCKATFLVYFSIPTLAVYIAGYILIYQEKLYFYVWLVYSWITLYMCVCTVCLGYNYGFHLYTMSMIPIIYYTGYMAYRLNVKEANTKIFCTIIVLAYLFCTFYVVTKGPVYKGGELSAAIFWTTNSIIVFSFLIFYTRVLIRNIISSEEKLKEMSFSDRLTGLYNRHYMVDELEKYLKKKESGAIAMIDIDDFKKINDVYGHNAGDYVLKTLADTMRSSCEDCVLSRWGGEEFLVLIRKAESGRTLMEDLRRTVENQTFAFEGSVIKVSVTIGLAIKDGFPTIDKWIQEADDKLYAGKKNGKNVVVD